MSMPVGIGASSDAIVQRALSSYCKEEGATQALEPEMLRIARHFDAPGMECAAAIYCWGPSGAKLLASYLNGHPNVVMLPMFTSAAIYPFFGEYKTLSVWEKLVVYPAYSDTVWLDTKFFEGDYSIAAADYYAAVQALFAVYGDRTTAWLQARQRFFQFLHVAYSVAIRRRPENPRPLMIYTPHIMDDALARQFVEDFPKARFMHTIRDPISAIDSCFEWETFLQITVAARNRPDLIVWHLSPAYKSMHHILSYDRAHLGMEACTRAVRFEDMHHAPEATMRGLADWLGIPYDPCLLESTWNGAPYVNYVRGVSWSGPNPANARRRRRNLSPADQLLAFALLHENFVAWNYRCPRPFRQKWIRLCIIAVLWLIPMKMEIANAGMIARLQVLPALRSGRIRFACRAPLFLVQRRLWTMRLIGAQARARLSGKWRLLKRL